MRVLVSTRVPNIDIFLNRNPCPFKSMSSIDCSSYRPPVKEPLQGWDILGLHGSARNVRPQPHMAEFLKLGCCQGT